MRTLCILPHLISTTPCVHRLRASLGQADKTSKKPTNLQEEHLRCFVINSTSLLAKPGCTQHVALRCPSHAYFRLVARRLTSNVVSRHLTHCHRRSQGWGICSCDGPLHGRVHGMYTSVSCSVLAGRGIGSIFHRCSSCARSYSCIHTSLALSTPPPAPPLPFPSAAAASRMLMSPLLLHHWRRLYCAACLLGRLV